MTSSKFISEARQDLILKQILRLAKGLKITSRKDTKFLRNDKAKETDTWTPTQFLAIDSTAEDDDYYARKQEWVRFEFATSCIGLEKRNKLKITSSLTSPAGCTVTLNVSAQKLEKEPITAYVQDILVEYLKQWKVKLVERKEYMIKLQDARDFESGLGDKAGYWTGRKGHQDWHDNTIHGKEGKVSLQENGTVNIEVKALTKTQAIRLSLFVKKL